jgi:DNA-binding NarL/FixJ family response regulator
MPSVRILLVDDHEMVRAGLRAILAAEPDMDVVGEAADGEDAVQQAATLAPDVVVMDLSMPTMPGTKATETIHRDAPATKVIALTRHSEPAHLQQVLRAGAAGYVLKQSSSAVLVQAVRAVVGGGTFLDPGVAREVTARFGSRAVTLQTERPALSGREAEVLRFVAWGHSNKEIAQELGLSVKTVETHKANAMHKLGMTSRIEIVRYALLEGWLEAR